MVQLLAGIISLRRVLEANPGRSHCNADTLPLRHSANTWWLFQKWSERTFESFSHGNNFRAVSQKTMQLFNVFSVVLGLARKEEIRVCALLILAGVRRASRASQSRMIPKNVSDWTGPSALSEANGIESSWHNLLAMVCSRHALTKSMEMLRKSSK